MHDIVRVMRHFTRRPGHTLLEIALVLTILTTLFAIALPAIGHGRAVIAVRAARSELLAAIATARAQAILVGGAQIIIEPNATMRVERADGVALGVVVDLADRYGVTVQTSRSQPVVLHYDALGIGRLTNTTITVRRGRVMANVIVSAYGRARI